MTAYYNEIDPYAAQWLRNLIAENLIAPGDVDERSIADVQSSDLAGYVQCHFFAGIGGWSYAARLAGWPDDRPLWTGSCPCQPFSVAGKREGRSDERHLWPVFFGLIRTCRPDVVMGEQVAAAVGKHWLDGVHADLESIGYACGAAVVPACAVDAPHRRERVWFVADRDECQSGSIARHTGEVRGLPQAERQPDVSATLFGRGSKARHDDVADANEPCEGEERQQRSGQLGRISSHSVDSDVADAAGGGWGQGPAHPAGMPERDGPEGPAGRPAFRDNVDVAYPDEQGPQGRQLLRERTNEWSAWADSVGITGSDGKTRRVEPGIRLLAHGVPARVGKLRAYGNAIVPQVAAEVIGAYLEARAAA